ncbi:hypothetical protein CH373_02405 [Leptospira perolatii]|uniref:Uncharacterized protein n=1 Tax=Leptospira perolatii TaxID=2023191 RepID=A0A2M9ZSA5_9LEPT|nr:hypothetical protein [Leptospira perolatii]PJZ71370.1 hypothetical protein CH360_02405 [Leptospira perolatii]PJZ74904.1 hypothetical protein CH373_02405 [Leptospira perolatii]
MIYSIILTLLCAVFFFLGARKGGLSSFNLEGIRTSYQNSIHQPLQSRSVYWFLFFLCFSLLPFFWGLTFFLKTDANVIVVIVGLAWVYFWSRTFILFH